MSVKMLLQWKLFTLSLLYHFLESFGRPLKEHRTRFYTLSDLEMQFLRPTQGIEI